MGAAVAVIYAMGIADQSDGLRKLRTPFVWQALTCSIVTIYALLASFVRPLMYADSGWGFLVWDSMRRDGAFNYLVAPNPNNIGEDATTFVGWWSPGQYLIPGIFETFGFSLGSSIVLVTALCAIAGLGGWYLLYQAFGFSRLATSITVALIALTRFFALPFGIYNGGEIILFGAAPWFALVIWKTRGFKSSAAPSIFIGLIALCFAKLSGLIFALSTICGGAISSDIWRARNLFRNAIIAGIPIAVFGLLFQWAWLSKGATPVSGDQGIFWSKIITNTVTSISAIFSSALSLGELASYIFIHPERPILPSLAPIYYGTFPIVVGLIFLMWLQLRRSHAEYLRFAFITASIYILIMVVIYVRGGSIGEPYADDRYFRPAGLVLLIGIVHAFLHMPGRIVRSLAVSIAAASSVYGMASFFVHVSANLHHPLGARGFRHAIATKSVLNFIRTTIDANPSGTTVVLVTSPEIGLEVRLARVLANHADFQSADELRKKVYNGRVPHLYILVQNRLITNTKAEIILRSFVDYPIEQWQSIPLGEFTAFAQ